MTCFPYIKINFVRRYGKMNFLYKTSQNCLLYKLVDKWS